LDVAPVFRLTAASVLLTGLLAASACAQDGVAASAGAASVLAPGDTPGAAASSPAEPAQRRRAPLEWRLDIQAPGDLKDLLEEYLDLSRYQQEVTQQIRTGQGVRISRSELRRLVAAAPEQVRALLEAEGYFAALIRTRIDDEVEGRQLIHLEVEPGPRSRIERVQMIFEGEFDNLLAQEDAGASKLHASLDELWGLPKGAVFRQSEWSAAKNGMMARLRSDGYPLASWSGSAATVDAQAHQARLLVVADSGPLFRFGDVFIEGLERQSAQAILNVAPFNKGEAYREQALLDYQERLQKLNLYESVFVTLTPDADMAAAAPVTVQVREAPLQQALFGVGVSSDTGPRISVEHLHRRPFGWDWQAKSLVHLGRIDSDVQLDLISDPREQRKRWLMGAEWARKVDNDDATTESQRLRFGQTRDGERLARTRYVEYQRAVVTSDAGDTVTEASAVSGLLQWAWRDVDSQLLPTKGITALGSFSVGQSFATSETSGTFGRAYGRFTWYRPLGSDWYATSRLEAGRVYAADNVSIPDTLLFRAGGDESVRGYAYRDLGVQVNGVTVGGRAMATGSIEVAHPILKRLPSILGAVFLDVGGVDNDLGNIRLSRGYGVGVRWRSPVGALKLDLAYGEQRNLPRLHFSVGVSL